MQRFSLRLQELIERRGLSSSEFAAKLQVDASTVHRWLKEGQIPQPRTVAAIAELLSVEQDWLAGSEGAMPVTPRVEEDDPSGFRLPSKEGYRAAFDYVLERMPLPELIERLSEILSDESQSAEQRLQMARSILPAIERRKTELQLQMQSGE